MCESRAFFPHREFAKTNGSARLGSAQLVLSPRINCAFLLPVAREANSFKTPRRLSLLFLRGAKGSRQLFLSCEELSVPPGEFGKSGEEVFSEFSAFVRFCVSVVGGWVERSA